MAVRDMNRPATAATRSRPVFAFCALAAVLAGTPARAGPDAIIWEGDDQSVFLAPQDEEAAPPNDHPATLAPQRIESMLANLRFRYTDQADSVPVAVFNEEQVEILGQAIAAGLARAEPSQDVSFSVVGAHRLSPGAFARRNRVTAGRAFFRKGKLHLIFGEIQSPYRKKNIYGRIDQDFHPRQYGSRATPGQHDSVLIASASASLRGDPGGGGTRKDWIVFDTEAVGMHPPLAPASGESNAQPAPRANTNDIEQRLATLKRLREQELISEDAYRQKVDEILQEL